MPFPNPFGREARLFSASAGSQVRDIPADLWVQCENARCRDQIYVREYENNLRVCQKCGHHARLGARERIAQLVDEGSFEEFDADLQSGDPLAFVSLGQSYGEKLAEAQAKTNLAEAAVCGRGRVDGLPAHLGVLDFGFMGASMGSVVGEKITRTIERACHDRVPLITVSSSGGARMQEGIFSLMQLAKTSVALRRLSEEGVPFISVLADPTTGGVTASFAGVGDVLIAEPGALIGFAGPRVIEQVTKQKLPPSAQRAEFLLEHGMVDMVTHRRELRSTLGRLLRFYKRAGDSPNGRA